MNKKPDLIPNRRKFLSLSVLGGVGLVSQQAGAIWPIPSDEEMVPMLTTDGKVVSVPKRVLDQTDNRKKASHQDIQEWTSLKNKTAE